MTDCGEFRLLAVADSHLGLPAVRDESEPKGRTGSFDPVLLRRAIEGAGGFDSLDAVALLGDLIDDGSLPSAEAMLEAIRAEIEAAAPDTPLLVISGNHDGDPDRVLRVFAQRPGLREIGPYRFVTFADPYGEGNLCTRSESDRRLLRDIAAVDGGPIIVLQHNPIDPVIESDYPYMHTNRDTIFADYNQVGVLLSISGHYHAGQDLHTAGGVHYLTVPAMCKEPFPYALVTLRGRDVRAEVRTLDSA